MVDAAPWVHGLYVCPSYLPLSQQHVFNQSKSMTWTSLTLIFRFPLISDYLHPGPSSGPTITFTSAHNTIISAQPVKIQFQVQFLNWHLPECEHEGWVIRSILSLMISTLTLFNALAMVILGTVNRIPYTGWPLSG